MSLVKFASKNASFASTFERAEGGLGSVLLGHQTVSGLFGTKTNDLSSELRGCPASQIK